jgi:hypothetical protein
MAGKQARQWKIDEIIALGTDLIGSTIEHMKMTEPEDRDANFAKSLSAFMKAAVDISKDQREAAAFLAARKLDGDDINAILIEHLRTLSSDDLLAIMAAVRGPTTPTGESQAHV